MFDSYKKLICFINQFCSINNDCEHFQFDFTDFFIPRIIIEFPEIEFRGVVCVRGILTYLDILYRCIS